MTRSQSNYFNMLNAVLLVLDNNSTAWEHKTVVKAGRDRLSVTVTTISDIAVKQKDNDSKGTTAAKEDARNDLENLVYLTTVRVRSYAGVVNDIALSNKMTFSRSDFDGMRTNDLLSTSRMVADVCNANPNGLAEYEITASTTTDIRDLANRVEQLYALRDTITDQRMETTDRMKKLFAQARREVKTLDNLVEGFVDDDTFAATYFAARRIHDLRGGRKTNTEEK